MNEIPENEADKLAAASWAADILAPEDFAELQTRGQAYDNEGPVDLVLFELLMTVQASVQIIRDYQTVVATGSEDYAAADRFTSWAFQVMRGMAHVLHGLGLSESDIFGDG